MSYRDRYQWSTETYIDGLEIDIGGIHRQISMAYRDRYRWSTETDIDGLQRQISMIYRDRYRWPTYTDIDGLHTQTSMAYRDADGESLQRCQLQEMRDNCSAGGPGRMSESQSREPEFESLCCNFEA